MLRFTNSSVHSGVRLHGRNGILVALVEQILVGGAIGGILADADGVRRPDDGLAGGFGPFGYPLVVDDDGRVLVFEDLREIVPRKDAVDRDRHGPSF